MIHKVIITEQDKILVDESAEIKEGDWYFIEYNKSIGYASKAFIDGCKTNCFKILYTINFSLDKDLPMVIVEDEFKNTLEKHYSNGTVDERIAFIFGYKAAQQKGVYSEEDLRNAFRAGEIYQEGIILKTDEDRYIKSLKQEYIELKIEEVYSGETLASASGFSLKTDAIKTIKTDRVNGQLMAYVEQTFKL